MVKIAFIGAGSSTFGRKLITDILVFPQLRKNIIVQLQDIDLKALNSTYIFLKQYKEKNHKKLENVLIKKTNDQKKAVHNAKYIVNLADIGGLEAFKLDLEIPKKYGITQCIGDTLGPGGVFRFLRSVPFLKKLMLEIKTNGYSESYTDKKNFPILFNYANPMAMNTWYCNSVLPNSTIGLCHGVKKTALDIKKTLKLNSEDFRYQCAGINHMAWFLKLFYKKDIEGDELWENAYPRFYTALSENNSPLKNEKVRIDMMKATGGYFMTESSGHLSEYLPYYRKREDLLEKYSGNNYIDTLEHAIYYNKLVELADKNNINPNPFNYDNFKEKSSIENLAQIINAIETKSDYLFNGNLMNKNQKFIKNLPKECCVEIPIAIRNGILSPQGNINLPPVISSLCISNIAVQKLAVKAAITQESEKIYQAVFLDPNSASVCSPGEIRNMVKEMIGAQSEWIQDFF